MTTPQQDSTHRRSATRAPVGRPIKLQFDDSMEVIEGLCRNISIGGMFIVFESSRPAGSLVRFELELQDKSTIRGLGEVVWIRSKSGYKGPEAGFGLKFRFLEQRDRQLIFKLVSQHIKDRLASREPAGEEGRRVAAPAESAELPPSIMVPPDSEPPTSPAEPEAELLPELDLPPPPAEPASPAEPAPPATPRSAAADEPSLFSDPEVAVSAAASSMGEEAPFAAREPPESDAVAFGPDLDPSVGDTPLYELGLDPEPPSPEPEPTAAFEDPSAGTPASGARPAEESAARSYLDAAPAEPEVDASPRAQAERASGASRRGLAMAPVIAVVVALTLAGLYLFKDQIRARWGGEAPAAATADAGSSPAPAGTEAEAAEAAAPPPEAAAPPPPAAEPSPEAAASPPEAAAPPPPAAAPPPPAAAPRPEAAAPPPEAAARPSPATAPAGGEFSRLVDISWSEAPGGLVLILEADGSIPTGRYRYFHLAGDSPREVIKLLGVRRGFGESSLAVGGPAVRRIRTGYHRLPGGNEQHVVIDLAGPRFKITEVRNLGSRLELLIGED